MTGHRGVSIRYVPFWHRGEEVGSATGRGLAHAETGQPTDASASSIFGYDGFGRVSTHGLEAQPDEILPVVSKTSDREKMSF